MHRASYEDPGVLEEVLALLGVVFPEFGEQERAARKLGLRWERCSTPFVHRDDGRIVAHVGVLEMPLVTESGVVNVGSVHAVGTHPEHRRRGYYRRIMEELLPWCDERYETLELCTDNPEYFESFGFHPVPEHRFDCGPPPHQGRTLRLERLEDPGRLGRLLAERAPVSYRLGVLDRQVLLYNEARRALHYAPDLDVVLSFDIVDGALKLWDVVGPTIPRLADILAAVGGGFDRIEVHFAPDQLGASLTPVADPGSDGVLMARGPYPVEGEPFKLPVTARC